MQGFFHCVWPLKMHFCAIFLLKNSHNSVENDRTGKKFTLVLKAIYKKLFLKYQVNARFPSLCLVSVFGGGKRRKKKVGKPIEDPVREWDAPIIGKVTGDLPIHY